MTQVLDKDKKPAVGPTPLDDGSLNGVGAIDMDTPAMGTPAIETPAIETPAIATPETPPGATGPGAGAQDDRGVVRNLRPPVPADPDTAPESAPTIEPRILERREQVARQRARRRWRVAMVTGAVVVVVGGTWITLHSAVLAARHVTVVGAVHTSDAAIVAAVGLQGQPLVDVNPGRVAARVEALPWVAHATVTRHWPSDVTVTVTERVAAAVVAGPGPAASVIDAAGRVLTTAAAQVGTVVLAAPVVPGRPGTMLGPAAAPGLAALAATPASLRGRLQHVDVAADGDVSLGLVGNIGVTMGPAVELPAKFEALVSVLADVPPTGPENIDVTVPDAPAVGPPVAVAPTTPAASATTHEARVGRATAAPQVPTGPTRTVLTWSCTAAAGLLCLTGSHRRPRVQATSAGAS